MLSTALSLSACAPLFSGIPADPDAVLIMPVSGTGLFNYEIEVSSISRDVYFIFSASADKDTYAVPSATALSVDGETLPAPSAMKTPAVFGESADKGQRIADFNRNPWSALGIAKAPSVPTAKLSSSNLGVPRASYTEGDTGTLKDGPSSWDSTCRYVSDTPIGVAADGTPRRLIVWVEDDSWSYDPSNPKQYLVTQEMVNWLAGKFLASGADNDVYDWLTAILGPEWGATPYSNLIDFDGDIHIVLADIEDDDEPNGGIVGYFWSLNNFTNAYLAGTPYANLSNERIMFVLDSVMFANPVGGGDDAVWSTADDWALEVYSTLAHEFQHMISFYQRSIVRDSDGADVWIDELCSMLAEDLLAERMGVPGPRGVDPSDGSAGPSDNTEGRMPLFNRYSYFPLAVTSSYDVYDYSTTYAFGAWLARNYGGASLLRSLVHTSASDESIVETAASAGGAQPGDLDSLIARWAASVLYSDREDMPSGYRYNSGGWFSSTLDGNSYRLGSIDAFRYRRYGTAELGPFVFTANGPAGQGSASSNVLFQAAHGFTGKRSFEINLPEGVRMYAVLK
ncbi:MAG: peptidase M30 [Spirochaetae bacterium HGW-Spirochaetae-3]|nr:MAG: peptidase M30 [Spirochaetae bacterium HGW-Spirochaetae-3]